MSTRRDLWSEIRKEIILQTKYLRHYSARVVDNQDGESKGRCKVIIPALGLDPTNNFAGIWAWPREKGANIPETDSWVEVYFREGNRKFPVYMGEIREIEEQIPPNWDGDPLDRVILNPKSGLINFHYNEGENTLELVMPDDDAILNFTVAGNAVTIDSNGVLIEDASGNIIESGSSGIMLTGTGGGEALIP